jgi:hypothetical protein
VRDAEAVDAARIALRLEPPEVFLPRDEVVHLLYLDAPEPAQLIRELPTPLVDGAGPDLRRDGPPIAVLLEREPERLLRAVHRGRVEQPAALLESRPDNLSGEADLVLERVPRPEPHDRAQAALVHQTIRSRASLPAA